MLAVAEDFKARTPAVQFFMLATVCWPLIALSIWQDVAVVQWPITLRGVPFQVDFANLWLGARAGISHDFGALFDAANHAKRAAETFGAVEGLMVWSYPPTAILLLRPFGWLSNYAWACVAWTGLGLALYVAALAHGHNARRRHVAAVAVAIAFVPGVFVALSYGQTAFFTSAALYFGIAFASHRPGTAALIIAALAIKPQLALAAAPALAARGAWRAFMATAVLVSVFLIATVLVLGWQPWSLFLSKTLPQQAQFLLDQSVAPSLQMSAYYMATALGLPALGVSGMAVQAAVTLTATALMWHVLHHETEADLRFLAIALATLNMSPYLQTYETPLLALAVGRLLLNEAALVRLGRMAVTSLLLATTLGITLTAGVVSRAGVNFSPLLLLTLFVPLLQLQPAPRLWRSSPRALSLRATPVRA